MKALWVPATTTGVVTESLIDAKADIITGSADDTAVRKAVGTLGQPLVPDSREADGLKYARMLEILGLSPARLIGSWSAGIGTTALTGHGLFNIVTEIDTTSSREHDNTGTCLRQGTSSSADNQAFSYGLDAQNIVTANPFCALVTAGFGVAITDTRFFVGFTQVNWSTHAPMYSDDPASSHCFGIQKRAGDTNYFTCTKDGTTMDRTDTGKMVLADVPQTFALYNTGAGTTLQWAIFNWRGVLVAGPDSLTDNLPGTTEQLVLGCGIRNTAAVIKYVEQFDAQLYV